MIIASICLACIRFNRTTIGLTITYMLKNSQVTCDVSKPELYSFKELVTHCVMFKDEDCTSTRQKPALVGS